MTLTYNPRLAKVKVNPNAKNQGHTSNGSNGRALMRKIKVIRQTVQMSADRETDGRTDRRDQTYYLPASWSIIKLGSSLPHHNAFLLSASTLKAERVDLHIKENRVAHHTDEYDHKQLILRRGQPFDLTITFNRPYNADGDIVKLQFVTGT